MEHHPLYCEENIWRLCRQPAFATPSCRVLLITNPRRTVPMLHQRAAPVGQPTLWDYHVVHLDLGPPARILDLDTALAEVGTALPALEWLQRSFPWETLPADLEPRFRVVDAAEFARRLGSDRSHMKGADGHWLAPPPPWAPPTPGTAVEPIPLHRYLDVEDPQTGVWLDRTGLVVVIRPSRGTPARPRRTSPWRLGGSHRQGE